MTKQFTLLLFIGLAFGQKNGNSTVGVGLILYNGQKTELVNIGEKVVIFFKDSVEQEMLVEINEIKREKVKIKELENGQTFEIELKNIRRIDRNITPNKARYISTLIGAIKRPTIQVNKTNDITLGFIKLKNELRSNAKPSLEFLAFILNWLNLLYFR